MPTIWSYGFINLDIIAQPVPHWPAHSGLVWVDRIDFKIGGVALNPAVTIAKLGGLPVGLIGYLGQDGAGQIIKNELATLGLDTSRLVTDATRPTGVCLVGVHPDTERSFIISAGANARLRAEPVSLAGLEAGDFFHLGGTASLADSQPLLEQARAQGLIISVDVAFDSSGQWWGRLAPLLPWIDIFMANALESEHLTGLTDPRAAAQKLAAAGPPCVVIKLGRAGCYLHSAAWHGYVAPFAIEAVDTTGAGDAFAGALLYGLAQDWPIEQAATLANAVGALSATVTGATEGVRGYADTLDFIKAQGRTGAWNW